ncbi:MAG: saccharopine dehydrogenase NADP-binding domain-containing protein [Gammaproteobacteria bacterium]|nr:saccharopine dehydrogenase NADP-binding domain-containing protein [Gammaproteobacteria bacterium]
MQWMIYGANGYTGELIAREAIAHQQQPILAGRNSEKVAALATELGLQARAFELNSVGQVAKQLKDIDLVVHCAGPFELTAEVMMKACIASKTHYLDITGELDVFELAASFQDQAKAAGVVLCPGVGFDVIPTDCVAAQLKQQMPDATHLRLGFDSRSRMSRGTAKTSVRRIGEGGAIRKNGKITAVPLAYKAEKIDFGGGEKMAMTIPWGDVSTAYYSTGIGNVEVFIPAHPKLVSRMRRMNWFRWLFRTEMMKNWLMKKIDNQPAGPKDEEREKHYTWVWGEVKNAQGETLTMRKQVLNGYTLTAQGAVFMAMHVLATGPAGGFYTPSKLYGPELVEKFLYQPS